ncbi:SMI1/KNR4 family protein [Streptomyces nigrescens]|uniref:SMI1/KNR4 family protein n=1 Tax=Streptomyces nigrescens TaxID=1920 RepID=UPI00224F49CF|nr:SMI1/KNR4 family protein [Streptomyces libani]MCX5444003.1 SMI1/KNR4 family protein [Streptomyces libani]
MPGKETKAREQSMVEQAVRPIVEALVANAPSGWTHAVLHCRAGRGGTSATGGYTPPRDRWNTGVPNPYRELMALAETLRKDRGWEPVSLEFRCRPSGEYRFVAFHDAITWVTGMGSGFQVVLDPDYRLPQPGLQQEPGTAAPAGDPETAVARFRAYLERRAAILGHRDELPPPATAAALDEAERRLGRRLPADLRALYTIADGDGIDYENRYLFQGNAWLSLKSLVAEHTDWSAGERPWYGWDLEWDAVVFDTTPADTVRRCGAHPGWLRFATSEDGNFLAIDTDPARNGRPGQLIRTGRDYDEGPAYLADSVTALLGHYLELLDQGAYERHGDHLSLLEPAGDPAPRQIIGEIPDEVPPTLQAIHINNASALVDLAPLTAAPHLRRLHLNRSTTADLTPVRELPVESLRITLDDGNLTPLAGHPHLTSLDLTTTVPTDLAPLRTIPHLRGLDLSRADAPDPTVLADLTELRYLALTGCQWTTLLDKGEVPPSLTAARLADEDATLDDALAWAARLGLPTENAFRATGSFNSASG